MSKDTLSKEFSPPPVDFSALILGFSSAALFYLGHAPIEGKARTKGVEKNLALARQNIDIINMLKAKTSGNLSKEESELITGVLTDLYAKCTEAEA
jgi:hypothetical protein